MSHDITDYRDIFLNDRPMMDTRAPIEFIKGAFPGVVNLPLMTDSERQRVGTCYKQQGQQAAIVLGCLTGGLIPCPAAITVLLLCLQVKEVALGGLLVLCFSIGLAITLVTVGAAAAIGARQASNRWPWLGTVARRAPYLSSVLIIGVGLYVGIHGWIGLNA